MSKEKRPLSAGEKNVIKIMSIVALIAAITFGALLYVNDFYEATDVAKKAILGNEQITVTEEDGYYLFAQDPSVSYAGPGTGKGIIFYPGGKVEETAYAPLLLRFANEGYEVYLIKMPAKLAILGANAAEKVMEKAPNIKEWTMMGHSLGGVAAATFSASHEDKVVNLVLLASYSMENLADKDIRVYSFYGSEDKVLNMESYISYHENLPDSLVETVIEGGNHANFGHYGVQEGDGKASITREEQQESVLDVFLYTENITTSQ